LRAAVQQLSVARETNVGYDREKFQHWVDADGDCQDTRAEVLVAESREGTTGGCVVETGEWFSYYDRETWTDASDVDIDHMVALAANVRRPRPSRLPLERRARRRTL
jgi:hypothetical protein